MEKMKIFLSKNGRRKLMSSYGKRDSSLSQVLNFHRNSEESRRIRSKAMNFYGGVIVLL